MDQTGLVEALGWNLERELSTTLLFIFRHTWKRGKFSLSGTSANLFLVLSRSYFKPAVCELFAELVLKKGDCKAPLTGYSFVSSYIYPALRSMCV